MVNVNPERKNLLNFNFSNDIKYPLTNSAEEMRWELITTLKAGEREPLSHQFLELTFYNFSSGFHLENKK